MKRLKSINRVLCLAAAASLLGQVMFAGVCLPTPLARATRSVLAAAEPNTTKQLTSAAPADSRPPAHSGPSCNAAEACDVHFMLKRSDRANPSILSPKLSSRVPQSPRPGLRAPSRASESQVLWIETCTSSLNVRHVRLQI
jgi:hypothetical protein